MSASGVNILSIDGGALMGVIPARILSYLDGSAATVTVPPDPGTNNSPISIKPATMSGGGSIPQLPGSDALNQWFEVIGGTSTGSLLAATLSVPTTAGQTNSANDALSLYTGNAGTIFPLVGTSTPLAETSMLTSFSTAFGNASLASIIAGLYGNPGWAYALTRSPASGSSKVPGMEDFTPGPVNQGCSTVMHLSDAPNTLLITSFNVNFPPTPMPTPDYGITVGAVINKQAVTIGANTYPSTPPGPQLLTNTTQVVNPSSALENLSVLQACLMSSAFPMLLPPVPADLQFTQGGSDGGAINYFVDGGIYAGSPALAVYFYCLDNNIPINSFISVGCGYTSISTEPQYTSVERAGALPFVGRPGWLNCNGDMLLMTMLKDGPGMGTDAFLSQALGSKFFRLNPPISGGNPPWSSAQEALVTWIEQTDTYMANLCASGATPSWQTMLGQLEQASPSS